MNIQTPGIAFRTADDFLAWNEGREGRREFVDGRVVEMMTGVSRRHWKLGMRLHGLISSALNPAEHDFGTADFGVLTSNGVRYPDYLVEKAGGSGVELATDRPIFIAEILSPSSMATDFGPKVREYSSIPTLRHYLIISQDEPRVWIWHREEDRVIGPDMIFGPKAHITLSAFDLRFALADLYHDIA